AKCIHAVPHNVHAASSGLEPFLIPPGFRGAVGLAAELRNSMYERYGPPHLGQGSVAIAKRIGSKGGYGPAANPSSEGALSPLYVTVRGVPTGISFASFKIDAFGMRTQPCET